MALKDDNIKICQKHGVYVDTGSGMCPQCTEFIDEENLDNQEDDLDNEEDEDE